MDKDMLQSFVSAGENMQMFRCAPHRRDFTKQEIEQMIDVIKLVCAFANCAGSEYQLFSRDLYIQQRIFEDAARAME